MSEAPNMNPNLNDKPNFRLSKINEVKGYFIAKIREKELMSKRLKKYVASFKYFDKSLIVFYATSCGIFIALFPTVIGAPVGIASSSFSFLFLSTIAITKKLLKTALDKEKKYNKIVILARSKLYSIRIKIPEAVLDNEISYEDFTTIINKEKNYFELKERIRMTKR